ncbi:MAG: HD domain-containing protein [Anaerolineales bacterium]|nr:HD domain-containing protein [Anaerolineales bacterium]MDW8277217.1 HD domain-containing phosphohydrolase [Anaerolineales bacterium]
MGLKMRLNVLILEDRPADAELILYEMKRSGYDCASVRVDTQDEYLRAIDEQPDIILADYSLPQFTAMQALHLLQEKGYDIPFIVVTGTISEEAAVETMKQGAADYLLKDRLSRLGQAVERALQQKALRDQKRKSDEALRLSEDKFSKAFRISPDAISITHLIDGTYIEINEGFTSITGYPAEEILGKPALAVNIWANLDEYRSFLLSMQLQNQVNNMEAIFKNKRGEHWFGLISARIIEVNREPCIISIIRDITERKRAEIELQRAHQYLAEAYDETIEGWSRVLDLRDKETEGHTQRVTEAAVRLARALGMSEDDIVHLRRGALLHDIGKMGISDRILQKPGALTDEEWAEMRKHPEYALQMLYPISYLRPALDIPYCHHERWDGSGYPRGLKGEEIPLAARIFSIVDVWDALLSNRPYRRGCTEESVLEYIRKYSGIYFDPKIVEVFIELHNKGVFRDTRIAQISSGGAKTESILTGVP